MPIPEPTSLKRLADMDVEVWRKRDRGSVDLNRDDVPEERSGAGTAARVRLASGSGDWLLVMPVSVPGRYRRLVSDITATIGPERCRFGQWADSPVAGIGLDELAGRGVRNVLAFGPVPEGADDCIRAPALEQLAADGRARRELWRALALNLEEKWQP